MGGKVKGGQFFGDQPSLSNLKDGDLSVTTDFRDIYGAILQNVLNQDETRVLSNWKTNLPIFN